MARRGRAVNTVITVDYDNKSMAVVKQDFQSLGKQAQATTGPLGSMTGALKGMALAAAGAVTISAITGFMKDSAQAAMEDEKSMIRLATAMENLGLAAETPGVEALIGRLSVLNGVADDELRPAFQKLVTATNDVAQAQDGLQLAMDIAAGTGRSLDQVSTALSRGYAGQTTGLSRLGAGLDQALLKSKDMDRITAALSTKFGGQAQAAAETYAGKMNRLTIAAGEAQEVIGFALLSAVDSAADAFGGVDGISGAMDGAAESIADMIGGVEVLVGWMGVAKSSVEGLGDSLSFLPDIEATPLGKYLDFMSNFGNVFKLLQTLNENFGDSVEETGAKAATASTGIQYAGDAMYGVEDAASAAAIDTNSLKDAFNDLNGALNLSQALDNFNYMLDQLDEKLKGNKRSFDGMGDAAKENRDTLRDAFSEAAGLAQKWAEENGKSVAEMQGYYNGLARNIVNQFVANKFKRSDVKKFLGDEGIWTSTGNAVGADLAAGIAQGVGSAASVSIVRRETARLVREAEQAARVEAESNSPSKLFARVGFDMADGVVEGLKLGKGKAAEEARKLIDAAYEQVKSKVEEAKQFGQGIADNLFGNLDIAKALDDAKAAGTNIVDEFVKQAELTQQFGDKMNQLLRAGLNPSTWQQIAGMSADRGIQVADAYLKGNTAEMVRRTNEAVTAARNVADAVGQNSSVQFMGAGIKAAVAMFEGLIKELMPASKSRKRLLNMMDDLADAMNRTATITVQTVYAGASGGGAPAPSSGTDWAGQVVAEVGPTPDAYISDADFNQIFDNLNAWQDGTWQPFATGGIVTGPTKALIGEAGPEAVIPLDRLADSLSTVGAGSGTSYNITVNAGVGDPRSIGQAVVEAVTRYERANGPVFARAS